MNGVTRWRCQHLIGDPIRFLLVDIARLVNREFGLWSQSLLIVALLAFAAAHCVISAGAFTL
jgi:hypothetical protein